MSARELLWRGMAQAGALGMALAGYRARLNILIFHSVGPRANPLGHWDTTEAAFEQTVRMLKHAFDVIALSDAVRHLADGTLPARAACITFDDGYADNFTKALPILQRHGVPATFFVASGYLNGGRMFNDALLESIRDCKAQVLDLRELGFGELHIDNVDARVAARNHLIEQLKPMPLDERDDAVAAIAVAAGISPRANLMMTRDQVAKLAASGMEIGAHTHRHPLLSSVSDAQVWAELNTNKKELEDIVDRPVRLFAYPNGRPGRDYHLRHARMVRDAGFDAAVSTAHGAATYGADPYQLPRFTPWARCSEEQMIKLLLEWREDFCVAQ